MHVLHVKAEHIIWTFPCKITIWVLNYALCLLRWQHGRIKKLTMTISVNHYLKGASVAYCNLFLLISIALQDKRVKKLLFHKEIYLYPESWIMEALIFLALLNFLSPAQNASNLSKSVSSACLPFTMHSKLGPWCQKRNLKVSNNCAAVLTI